MAARPPPNNFNIKLIATSLQVVVVSLAIFQSGNPVPCFNLSNQYNNEEIRFVAQRRLIDGNTSASRKAMLESCLADPQNFPQNDLLAWLILEFLMNLHLTQANVSSPNATADTLDHYMQGKHRNKTLFLQHFQLPNIPWQAILNDDNLRASLPSPFHVALIFTIWHFVLEETFPTATLIGKMEHQSQFNMPDFQQQQKSIDIVLLIMIAHLVCIGFDVSPSFLQKLAGDEGTTCIDQLKFHGLAPRRCAATFQTVIQMLLTHRPVPPGERSLRHSVTLTDCLNCRFAEECKKIFEATTNGIYDEQWEPAISGDADVGAPSLPHSKKPRLTDNHLNQRAHLEGAQHMMFMERVRILYMLSGSIFKNNILGKMTDKKQHRLFLCQNNRNYLSLQRNQQLSMLRDPLNDDSKHLHPLVLNSAGYQLRQMKKLATSNVE